MPVPPEWIRKEARETHNIAKLWRVINSAKYSNLPAYLLAGWLAGWLAAVSACQIQRPRRDGRANANGDGHGRHSLRTDSLQDVQDSSNLLFLKRWVKQGSLSPRQFCLDCDVRCRATLELPSAAGLDAYSATLAIATTPTSEQASRGHLLRPTRRPLDRPPDVRQPYFSQQTTATSAELESGSSQSRGELNQRLLSESKQTLYAPSFSTDCYVHA